MYNLDLYCIRAWPFHLVSRNPSLHCATQLIQHITQHFTYSIPHHHTHRSQLILHNPQHPALSPSERTHTTWLAKRLLLKKGRTIVGFGQHQIYKEFNIDEIPKKSRVLMEVGRSELCDRHVRAKELDDTMFRKYCFLQSGECVDGMGS